MSNVIIIEAGRVIDPASGTNGVRTIINDYTEKDATRIVLKTLLFASAAIILILGTLVIFTFDPCVDPSSTLQQCVAPSAK